MPLDSELKSFLERIEPFLNIDPNSMKPEEFRKMSDEADIAMRTSVIEVEQVRDLEIPVDGGKIRGRLYSDSDRYDSLIMYFHGGGFVFGSVETHDSVCRLIAKNSGCKVLSVDYRLAPEHKFPTAPQDAYSSYMWVLDHSGELGVKAGKIGLAGDSAGGNLSSVVSMMARDNGKRIPKAQLLFYPLVTLDLASYSQREYGEGYLLRGPMGVWFMQQYMNSPADFADTRLAPLNAMDQSRLPQTVVFTAEYDQLRDQGETYVSRLKAAGTEATGIRAIGMMHGFVSLFEISVAAKNYLLMASSLMGHLLRE